MAKSKWDIVKTKLFEIEMWCRNGEVEKDIAKKLGVALSTFNLYKKKHPALVDALRKGKEVVDFEVEDSLYKKCIGFYVKEEKAFKCKEIYYDKEGRRCEREKVKVVEVDVYMPPDTLAMAMWLNNRKSDRWKRNAGKENLDEKRFEFEKEIKGDGAKFELAQLIIKDDIT